MIYTVTLNPALDYVIEVSDFQTGRINRSRKESVFCGGKGINVSCILKELGLESTALGFTAGFTGAALEDGLAKQGIHTDFIHVKDGMTRINVKMKSGNETEINGIGPNITEEDFAKLKEKTSSLVMGDILILSGSIPSCMAPDAYEQIVSGLREGVHLIVDAEKDLLVKILKYRPFLIKPNNLELAQIFETEIRNDEDIIYYAQKLRQMGARNVLVSMAKDGAILAAENDQIYQIGVARGTVVSSVGAGDSMVAGFTAGYIRTRDYAYAMKLGTACGGATAFHAGLADKEEIMEVFNTLE